MPSPENDLLMRMFISVCRKNDILCTPDECFRYMNEFPERDVQMSLFDMEEI